MIEDKMPIWMLKDMTDEQLRNLYEAMPLVKKDMTYNEFKEERERQKHIETVD